MKILLLLCLICILYASFDMSYALSEVECVIQVTPHMYPVYYNGDERMNPDGTFYPGDGFHYLFEYSGSDTCTSFSVNSIKSGGAIYLSSHDISNSGFTQNHSHKNYDVIPKYLTTTHYYVDKINYCRNNPDCSSVVLAENPSYSVREDQTIPTGLQRLLDGLRTASTYSLRIEETQSWGLTEDNVNHSHETDKHVFEDSSSIILFDEFVSVSCSNLEENQGCVFGHAEIKADASGRICLVEELAKLRINTDNIQDECIDNPNNLSLTVTGYKLVFETTKYGNVILKQVKVSSGSSAVPNVRTDDINIIFENPPISDIDGYDSKNLDSTYYVGDYPSIHVKPDLPFRDVRNNTLTFDVSRINTPIDEISTYTCKDKSCILNVVNIYGNHTSIDAINGDRVDVFEPQSFDYLGVHQIKYNVKLSNIDRLIQDVDGQTNLFIVDYDPQFGQVHPFVNWDSVGKTSLEKIHSVGMHYLGSQGNGENDDDSELHELRRAKINDYYYAFFGQTFDFNKYVNELAYSNVTQVGTISYFEDLMIDFSYMNITATQLGGSDVLSKNPHSSVSAVLEPSWDDITLEISPSMLSKTNSTILFEREGYGRLWVKFDNLAEEVNEKTLVNATLYGTTSSKNFGGYDIKYLSNYEYLFPYSPTDLLVNITGIHSNKTQNNNLEISVMLGPYLSNNTEPSQIESFDHTTPNKTVYIPRYFQEHAIIAGIENGNVAMQIADFHDIANSATYTGTQVVSMNKSIAYIPEIHWEMLGISSDDDFFQYPEYVSSNVPGLYTLYVDANEKTKKYPAKQYAFNEYISEFINVDQDNTLETLRFGDVINIFNSDKFGNISSIYINNTKIDRHCYNGCFFIVPHGDTVQINTYNMWGGMASAISMVTPPMNIDQEFSMLEKTLNSYLPHILISAVFLFSYAIIKRSRKTMG